MIIFHHKHLQAIDLIDDRYVLNIYTSVGSVKTFAFTHQDMEYLTTIVEFLNAKAGPYVSKLSHRDPDTIKQIDQMINCRVSGYKLYYYYANGESYQVEVECKPD